MTTRPDSGPALRGTGNGASALRLTGVTKRFGSFVANDAVDLDIAWGEIHALLGENGAGKTTLMRIVTGLYTPDEGDIELDGEPVRFRKPEHALRAGIGMVHQHFTLVPTLTELENLAIAPAAVPWRNGLTEARHRAQEVAAATGLRISPDRLVADASVGERQRLEIVKLLCRGARILIFDEPSAALSPGEWDELANLMRRLAAAGHAVILISHKLSEVFSVADRYTVLRRGAVSGSGTIAEATPDHLVTLMVGDRVADRPPLPAGTPGPAVLTVRGLDVARDDNQPAGPKALQGIDLEVRRGEILGIAGVAGSGQSELVEVLMGIRPALSGAIEMAGRPFTRRSPREFFQAGGAVIPEDRHHAAIVPGMTLWENITLRSLRSAPLNRQGVLDVRAASAEARRLMDEFDVRADSENLPIGRLSGGNQQKAVLARELSGNPDLLIAAQPVRGLDVRAADFVYRSLVAHRERGGAVLLISMDLDEVISMSDRIAVLAHGRIQGVVDAAKATRASLGALMTSSGEAL
ncbi:nucleoside ABC transporter ATP-binding protein [Micromonospora pallida]|uniref:Nucleoside ABC transporter ATP-binding protein n=1 Tax=Micromonospora pallida TaxID=145854 RepID=A0A1C6RVP7_9ACTN|nr:ABC transporter ATP-binding protein [Micromonospora pallida]SCL21245.1 nucleoside ABC transporter ATP-binding protein [Micromonospora pallida]